MARRDSGIAQSHSIDEAEARHAGKQRRHSAAVPPLDKNEIIGISLWDKKEQLDAYTKDTDPQVVKLLQPCFHGTPDVRVYEVSNSTSHKVAAV